MLQQTQVKDATPYFERFVKKFPDLKSLALSDEQEVLSLWSGLGYYARARNLRRAAQQMVQDHQGSVPKNTAELLELPGIGPYTAGAISSIAYNRPSAILDGNVHRVLSRYTLKESKDALWKISAALVEEAHSRSIAPSEFNQSLMELGALVCKPVTPSCAECPLNTQCLARKAGLQAEIPAPRKKTQTEHIELVLAVLAPAHKNKSSNELFLLQKRTATQKWFKNMWELPAVQISPGKHKLKELAKLIGAPMKTKVSIDRIAGAFAHRITHHQFKVHVAEGQTAAALHPTRTQVWTTLQDLEQYPVSSMVGKALALTGRI